ncbi:SusC/RagA family TonB-linked outer membrane protein [Mucilaginibacter sp.]
MRKTITILFIFLLSGISVALAQNITVKGTVVDKTGAGLPGVTVTVKSTTQGTITDVDGNYTISAPANGTLRFSFVGFNPQDVAVSNRPNVNVTLEDNTTGLNEVVVIGYGTQKKATVTGAISGVTAADLKDQPNVRVDDALEGHAAGVTVTQSSGAPGSSPNIYIRGAGSLGDSYPLYVVDGQIWDNGGYDAINPNDIESIQVLKDASAAIYGSRSSNGVVLITTKKGAIGTPKVTYNFYYGTQSVTKKVGLANASQYAQLSDEAAANDGTTQPFTNPSQYGTGTNWQNQIFGNAPIMQQNLAVSGGTDKSNYFTSVSYFNQEGIVTPKYSDYKRATFRVNTNSQPKKWFSYGENFTYSYVQSTTNFNTNSVFGGPLSDALNLDPLTPVVVTNVAAQPNASTYTNPNFSPYIIRNAQGQPYGISNYVANEIVNPIAAEQLQNGNYGWSHNLFGDAFAQITPIPGLNIKTDIAAKQSFYGSDSFTPLYYLNANNSNIPPATNNQFAQFNRNLEWNWDNTATYTRQIGKHNFSILLGQSSEEESGDLVQDQNYGEPITSYQQASFDFNLPQVDRYGYAAQNQPLTHASLFSRVTYNYDEKYLLDATIRRDGSSKFGSDNVYGTFPAISAGWVATKEDFFPKNSFVDYFKLRASYASMGNELTLGEFQYSPTVSPLGTYVFGNGGSQTLAQGYGPGSLPNAALKWEQDKQTDIGFDAIMFHNFNITVDFYDKKADNLLLNVPPPAYAGVSGNAFENAGGMSNKGVELQLGYNKQVGQFKLNLSGNISYNKNEVTSLAQLPYLTGGAWQGATISQILRSAVGEPFNSFYGYKVLGIFQSQAQVNAYKDKNGNLYQPNAKPGDYIYQSTTGVGPIGPSDREFLGSITPPWSYGFNFAVNYKQWDLAVFGQGVWGNKVLQEYRRLDIATANYPTTALDAWTPTNTNTNVARLTNLDPNGDYHNLSSALLQSGAYFRVKSLQLGYTLPKSVDSKLDLSRVHIYVSGDNLFTITKYNGFDPEVWGGSNQIGGVDQGVYPTARTLRVGVDVTL